MLQFRIPNIDKLMFSTLFILNCKYSENCVLRPHVVVLNGKWPKIEIAFITKNSDSVFFNREGSLKPRS